MAIMTHQFAPASSVERQREITKFIQAARQRSDHDPNLRERGNHRHHRSWPLVVCEMRDDESVETGVALSNANETGLAFLSTKEFHSGETVLLKLFWHDPDSPCVPAVVRHVHETRHGYLVGCRFEIGPGDAEPGGASPIGTRHH